MLDRQGLMRISGYLLHGCRGRPIGRFLLASQMDTDEDEKTRQGFGRWSPIDLL